MAEIEVVPGAHISPDSGLSDDFSITVSTPDGPVQFYAEPREWLAEFQRVVMFPVGARYEYQLSVSSSWFRVRVFGNSEGRLYQFTVFDVISDTSREIMLSGEEVEILTARIQHLLDAARR